MRLRRKSRLLSLALCLCLLFSMLPLSGAAFAAAQDCGHEECAGDTVCLQDKQQEKSSDTSAQETDKSKDIEKKTSASAPGMGTKSGEEKTPKAGPASEADQEEDSASESLGPGVYGDVTVLSLPRTSDTKQLIGTGTADDPLLIYTADDLRYFALSHNAGLLPEGLPEAPHLRAASAAIDLNTYGRGWEPIGTVDRPFKGTFGPAKGIAHVSITDLSVDDQSFNTNGAVAVGLFGATDGAKLTSIRVTGGLTVNGNGQGEGRVGMLVGQAVNTEIQSCSATGSILCSGFATGYAGGLAGMVKRTKGGTAAAECAANVNIMVMSNNGAFGGGLIGRADVEHAGDSVIYACYAAGPEVYVMAAQDIAGGGLVGVLNAQGGAQLKVLDSHAAGKQYAAGIGASDGQLNAGGLIGTAKATGGSAIRIERCYAVGTLEGTGEKKTLIQRVGALVGLVTGDADSSFALEGCAALTDKVSIFLGNNSNPGNEDLKLGTVWGGKETVNASANSVFAWSGMKLSTSGNVDIDDTTAIKKDADEWKDSGIWTRELGFAGRWKLDERGENRVPILAAVEGLGIDQNSRLPSYIKGLSGGTGNVYTVSSAEELSHLAGLVNDGARNGDGKLYAQAEVRVINDIEMSNSDWNPIGTMDHPFQGSFIGWDEAAGKETTRTINGLSLGIQMQGKDGKTYVCGLFGNVEAKEESGVRTNARIRGIALTDVYSYFQGYADDDSLKKGMFCAGALVGRGAGLDVEGCTANGKIDAFGGAHMYAGGLVGLLESPADGADAGSIRRSSAHMEVQAEESIHVYAGGLLGGLKTENAKKESIISSCYAAGVRTVARADQAAGKGVSAYSGGIVGYVGGTKQPGQTLRHQIEDCYATGAQTAEASLTAVSGGIVGNHDDAGDSAILVRRCYATGSQQAAAVADQIGRMAAAGGIVGNVGEKTGATSIDRCAALGFSVDANTGTASGGTVRIGRVAGAQDGADAGTHNCALGIMQVNGGKVMDSTGQNNVGYGRKHGNSVDSEGWLDGTKEQNIWTKAVSGNEADPGLGFFADPTASAWVLAGWPAAPTLKGVPGQDGAYPPHLKGFENVGTDAEPILTIRSVEELSLLAALVNGGEQYDAGGTVKPYAKLTYYLLEDLDLSKVHSWTAIGGNVLKGGAGTSNKTAFAGTFAGMAWDGDSKQYVPAVRTISNLDINRERSKAIGLGTGDSYDEGLFGYVSGASIANIALKKVKITFAGVQDDAVTCYAGGLVGRAKDSSFTACSVEGYSSVRGYKEVSVGGLVGIIDDGTSATSVERCFGTGNWTARGESFKSTPTEAFAGGLIGSANLRNGVASLSIRDCYATGTAIAWGNNAFAGGLAAALSADNGSTIAVERCYTVSEVESEGTTGTAGGLIGMFSGAGAKMKDVVSFSTKVTAQPDAGRVCGNIAQGAAVDNVYAWENMQVNGKSVQRDVEAKVNNKHGANVTGSEVFDHMWWKDTLKFSGMPSARSRSVATAWIFKEGYLPLLDLPSVSGDVQQQLRPFHLLNIPGSSFTLEITADRVAMKKSSEEVTVQLTATLKDTKHPDLIPTITPSGYEWAADYGRENLTVAPDMADSSKATLTFTPKSKGTVNVNVRPAWYGRPMGTLSLTVEEENLAENKAPNTGDTGWIGLIVLAAVGSLAAGTFVLRRLRRE